MKSKITLLLLTTFFASAQQMPQGAMLTVTSTIPYQGYEENEAFTGQGVYEIFYDNVNSVLDKPIILVDGFDPTDNRSIPQIYEMLDYGDGNLATDLRNQGYDIIILNFPNYTRSNGDLIMGGSDYIQRNAFVLVELINMINGMKTGSEKNVVIGPSMGGLIARYALRYMEMNSMEHDTRLYISFDAPHKGANIPIGFQHLFNVLAYGPLGDATLQVVVDAMLRSPASRQMLIDQFEAHLQAGSETEFNNAITLPTGKANFRDAFQTEIDAMGFPENTRNIAIVNGSGNGSTNGTPGMEVMNHTFDLGSGQRAIVELHYTPEAGETIEVSSLEVQLNVFVWITIFESVANSQAPATSDGLDTAPGGRFDISSLSGLAGSNAMLTEFFDNLTTTNFTFIPSISALAVDQPNWYTAAESLTSPFDAVHIPMENQNHVTITSPNLAFVLNEILNPLATQDVLEASVQVKNPVDDKLLVQSTMEFTNVSVSITDISGKTVANAQTGSLYGTFEMPVSLGSGIYFLKIQSDQGSLVRKIVKR